MRSNLPPVVVDGFHHAHALTGIAERLRPEWGATRCTTCSGRGARNDFIHLDSMRCRLTGCSACDGSGWLSADGARHHRDIVMRNGRPCWTITVTHPHRELPPCLHPDNLVPATSEPLPEFAEAA